MANKESQLYDRVLGCLIGTSAGDALGQPCRGLDWRGVQDFYGNTIDFHPWPREANEYNRMPAGHMGDLARLAISLSARAGRTSMRPRVSLLIDELFAQDTLDSLPAQAAMARINAGIEPSRSAVPELAGPEAIHIAISVGITNIGDPEAAFLATRAIAGPILLGPSLEVGQVFAAGVAAALMPDSTPAKVIETCLDIAPPSVSKVLQPASLFASEHLGHPPSLLMPAIHDRFSSRSEQDPHGPTVESLAVAMILVYVNDGLPEQSITSAVSYGGWAHATAAAAGAISGALSGASDIPEKWAKTVATANPTLDFPATAQSLCRVILLEGDKQRRKLEQIESMAAVETNA